MQSIFFILVALLAFQVSVPFGWICILLSILSIRLQDHP